MSLNCFIHPRNPYKTPPNYKALAKEEPEFRRVAKTELSGKVVVDFADREVTRVLTTVLLRRDFSLNVNIPPETLVPALPLRLNYLLWLQDLLEENLVRPNEVVGLDVGVGAACIYPLLAAKHLGWNMLGTEANQESLDCAIKNVEANGLADKIKLFAAADSDGEGQQQGIFRCLETAAAGTKVTFTMCNPPFFADDHHEEEDENDPGEKEKAASGRPPRYPVPAGQRHEMQTSGGEVALVSRMIEESGSSPALRAAAQIYTCMLGHKSSMGAVKKILADKQKKNGGLAPNFVSTEFCQGRTMRWAVAWTFAVNVSLPDLSTKKQVEDERRRSAPVVHKITMHEPILSSEELLVRMTGWLKDVEVAVSAVKVEDWRLAFTIKTHVQNWKGMRRRRREKMRAEQAQKAQEEGKNGGGDASEPPAQKRARLDSQPETSAEGDGEAMETQEEEEEDLEAKPMQLCARIIVNRTEAKPNTVLMEMTFLYGAAGKNSMTELATYIKSRNKPLVLPERCSSGS